MNTDQELQNNTFPFQAGVFEIQDQTDPKLRDAEVIQHLATLMVGDAINDLRVHNHGVEGDQVRDKLADLNTTKMDREPPLLVKRDTELLETHNETVLVNLLIQPVPNFIQNLEGQLDDLLRLALQQQLRIAAV